MGGVLQRGTSEGECTPNPVHPIILPASPKPLGEGRSKNLCFICVNLWLKSNHSDKNQAKIRPNQTRKMKSNLDTTVINQIASLRFCRELIRNHTVTKSGSVTLRLCGQSQFNIQNSILKFDRKFVTASQGKSRRLTPSPPGPPRTWRPTPRDSIAQPIVKAPLEQIQNSKFTIQNCPNLPQKHAIFDYSKNHGAFPFWTADFRLWTQDSSDASACQPSPDFPRNS